MTDYLEQHPIDYIQFNLKRLEVFTPDEKQLMIRAYIRSYIKNHNKLDNLIVVINKMYPEHMDDINKLLILK